MMRDKAKVIINCRLLRDINQYLKRRTLAEYRQEKAAA